MGKHKEHKSKKSKKQKKEKKSKRPRHDSSASDDSHSSNDEIIWAESGGATASAPADLPPSNKPETKPAANDSPSSEEEVDEGADWLGIIDSKSKGNVKLAHLKRDILKREKATADNKVRYARELNSYYRDDSTKRFIEDPDKYWKNKSKAMETDSEEEDDSKRDKEYDDDDDSEIERSDKPVAKKLTDTERNALNAKIIKAEMLGDDELVAELKAKLKESENAPDSVQEVHYAKKKSKAEKLAAEEKMSVKELYFQTRNISSRDEAMRFVASTSKLRTNDDEYEEVKGKKKKVKLHHDSFERIRSNDDHGQPCGDCLEKLGKHLSLRFSTELKHCYVAFTPYEPFTANYCQIRSRSHSANNSVAADEECWTELRQAMRLVSSFYEQFYKRTVIFMETHFVQQKRTENFSRRHFVIECVPIKDKYEQDVRIYFHKAILESGEEWSINRKMIKLEGKPVTKMLPKGLGYFWVSFGPNFNGFAHVVEDENYFSKDFGKEVIGGLCDIEPGRWKRPRFQDYDAQMKRIGETKDKWNDFIRRH